ncbi:2447_t:CDS:2, partial [Racocetra persica]
NDARLNLKSIANKHRKEKKVESEKVRGSKESEVKKEEELSFIGSGKKSEQVQPKQEQIKNTKKLDGPVENFNSLHVDSVINDNLENYLDLYKVAENRMSIQGEEGVDAGEGGGVVRIIPQISKLPDTIIKCQSDAKQISTDKIPIQN